MPSLFERVGRSLTRKKPEISTSNRDSAGTALEGFEAVSPNDIKGYVAPAVTSPTQEKSQGALKSFLRAKSPSRNTAPQQTRAPLLSLHLPELSENGNSGTKGKLGIKFEDHTDPAYTDEVLAAKRLTTTETLLLAQKTSSALVQKGLEMPGIFKTFWHRQDPDSQRRLIIAFLQTLSSDDPARKVADGGSQETTDGSNPALETFNTRLNNTSPYDLAEVFKWALRHFKHDGASFGISSDEYGWYKAFADSEKTGSYPPDAYSTILAPLLPAPHLELLNSIFHLATSVAALGETNGVSGSKLSRSVGWWLLSERSHPTNGLVGFLQDWDTAARILEHLFLAYVRDQQRLGLMPKRLTQLVKAYPYPKQANLTTDQHYLPRPKFSTEQRTVLFVRAAVPANATDFYHGRPLQLLKDAIVALSEDPSANADYRAIWESLKRQATTDRENVSNPTSPVDLASGAPVVSVTTILSESAIHLFTGTTGESAVTSPVKSTGDLASSWVRSFSPARREAGGESTNTTAPVSPMEWDDFTGVGFAGGLHDSTTLSFSDFAPPPPKQGSATVSGGTTSKSPRISRGQRSTEFKRPRTPGVANGSGTPKVEETNTFPAKDASAILSDCAESPLEIDETLIEGWAEILTDKTVSRGTWPTFAIYELREPLVMPIAIGTGAGDEPNRIRWLAIETYVHSLPPTETSPPSSPLKGGKAKRSSSVKSDKRPRFGFFSSTTSLTGKDKEIKEEKREKRKDHARRASEISTESATGKLVKEPARSQVDLAAPPAIAEEPEPATPLKDISEEKATVLDSAVDATATAAEAEKDAGTEAFPSTSKEPGTLIVPPVEGSRFLEGSTPGTIPESITEPLETGAPHTGDKEVSANAPTVPVTTAAAAAAGEAVLLKEGNKEEAGVPVSTTQPPTINDTANDALAAHHDGEHDAHESQEQPPTAADEVIGASVAVASAPETYNPAPETQEDESVTVAAKVQGDPADQAEIDAQSIRDAEAAKSARLEQKKLEQERERLEERKRIEAAQLEREALAAKQLEEQAQVETRAAEEAERIRLEQERLEQEKEAERRRIQEAEETRRIREEQEALAALEEKHIHDLEEAEKARIEQEIEAARLGEIQRLADERQAEKARLAEIQRLEDERRVREDEDAAACIREQEAAAEKLRLEQEENARVAEEERLARKKALAEAALAEKLREEELERERIAAEHRLADEAEAKRLEDLKHQEEMQERAKVERESAPVESIDAQNVALEGVMEVSKDADPVVDKLAADSANNYQPPPTDRVVVGSVDDTTTAETYTEAVADSSPEPAPAGVEEAGRAALDETRPPSNAGDSVPTPIPASVEEDVPVSGEPVETYAEAHAEDSALEPATAVEGDPESVVAPTSTGEGVMDQTGGDEGQAPVDEPPTVETYTEVHVGKSTSEPTPVVEGNPSTNVEDPQPEPVVAPAPVDESATNKADGDEVAILAPVNEQPTVETYSEAHIEESTLNPTPPTHVEDPEPKPVVTPALVDESATNEADRDEVAIPAPVDEQPTVETYIEAHVDEPIPDPTPAVEGDPPTNVKDPEPEPVAAPSPVSESMMDPPDGGESSFAAPADQPSETYTEGTDEPIPAPIPAVDPESANAEDADASAALDGNEPVNSDAKPKDEAS